MQRATKQLFQKLADSLAHLEEPVNLIAICTGGITLAKVLQSSLRNRGKRSLYFEAWTNTVQGKRTLWKTNFRRQNYQGSAVIVEDVIWNGRSLPPIKRMLKQLNPTKKPYVVAIFDCNNKANFSIFK